MEINFFHSDPIALADQVFFFKRTLREAALRHDMHATFMANRLPASRKCDARPPKHRRPGERTQSLQQEDGSPSREFLWYVGGLQRYIPAAMALFAPAYVNSYRRLARYSAAPINIHWGTDNRTVGIRAPVAQPSSRRVENRIIGADANPTSRLPRR
jgi:glutamine synthetase